MPRKKKPPLDAASREYIDRVLERHPRPIPVPVPHPSDVQFRRWVIGLAGDTLHEEVRRRLNERWTFVRDALIAWPHEYLDDKTARFPTLIQFLERITIDSPMVGSAHDGFPMLQFRFLPPLRRDPVDPRLFHTEDGPPDPIEVACRTFEDHFFRTWLFRPSPYEDRSVDEYDRLLKALREVKTRARSGNGRRDLLAKAPTVDLAGETYQVPRNWRKRLSATLPPGEVARLLLSPKWGRDPQAVKELLAHLRKESPIAAAWSAYDTWLSQESSRLREIHLLICDGILFWPRAWPAVDK